ncbi:MAG: MFS transporter, partial [Rhodothermales bacterium]|nr:MFS transporter [Rhodothermales bacterium]
MMFSASAQIMMVSPILPEIAEALGTPVQSLGWLISAYTVTLAVVALITGPISDSIGRRRIILFGTAAMAVALYLHVVVTTFTSMMIVRGLAGAAGGMLSGGAVSYVGDYFPYERRGWATGWIMSGMAVGQILGIPIGKILAAQYGFRWPFLMFAVTMTLATVLVWWFVPQPAVKRETERLSIVGSLTKYGQLLTQRPVVVASLAYLLMYGSIGLYVVYLPLWMEVEVGIAKTEIASLFFVGGIANVIAGPLAGRVSDKVGRKPLIITSCVGLAVLMVLTTTIVTNAWFAYLVFGLAMVMVALRISPLQSLMTALVPSVRRGMLMSLAVAIGQVGMSVSASASGFLYESSGFFANTVAASVVILFMAVLVWKLLPEPRNDVDAVMDEAVAAEAIA